MGTREDFEIEITALKDRLLEVAYRYGNITKFNINIDYKYTESCSIIDWKEDVSSEQGDGGSE